MTCLPVRRTTARSAVTGQDDDNTTMAGPASGTAWPRTTKIPVPSVAPTLSRVSCPTPIVRLSGLPEASATNYPMS